MEGRGDTPAATEGNRMLRYVVTIRTGTREAMAAFGVTADYVAAMPTPPAPAMLRARPIR